MSALSEGGATVDDMPPLLTDRQHAMLLFERQWWRHAGAKDSAIRETFGLSPTRYYQLLGQLIDRPEAMQVDPLVVKRLRRLREQRAHRRAGQRLAQG